MSLHFRKAFLFGTAITILLAGMSACTSRINRENCLKAGFTEDTPEYSKCIQQERQKREQERLKQEIAPYVKQCLNYGFKEGTPEYAKCLQKEKLIETKKELIEAIEDSSDRF